MKKLFSFEDIEALLERIDMRKQEFANQQNILADKELGEYTLKEISGICSAFSCAADRVCQGCPFMPLCEYFDNFYDNNSCASNKEKILFADYEEDKTSKTSFSQLVKFIPDFKTYNVLTKYKRANNEVDITIEEIDKMEVTTEEIKKQVEELNDLKEILLAGDKLGFSYVTKDNEPSYTSETGYNPYCNNDICLWMEKPTFNTMSMTWKENLSQFMYVLQGDPKITWFKNGWCYKIDELVKIVDRYLDLLVNYQNLKENQHD